MAEEGSVYELEGLEKQLQRLLNRFSHDELQADSKPFCSDYRKLVEEYASHWQVALPQLRILEVALCYFTQASSSFTSDCDHVLHTLSSLALSVFELLLFFDTKDFQQEPLKHFTVTFQECYLTLARLQNVHLLQVERLVQEGGAWASPTLQAILIESTLPQNEVDGCLSSELPVFFELRVRFLLSCKRVSEALALAKCCAEHPTAGQHLFFLQVYLKWLYKTSQHDRLHKEVADLNGKDAVHIICCLELEETDELLLALTRVFLYQQLRRGDMYFLCDLVFVWSKLHSRVNTSKQALLEESHQLMLSAINVNSIFPFIRAILQELGEDGIQFCVELCANALESCLPCDIITKSLIYKTIAGLLPNDLEVCRACALLVFFLERTVEAYKMMYLLYMHPDQEYHVEQSPIRNHIRFETLQVLKKDLYFDPEFWNLMALRTNCLKLMSEKVVGDALEEIMEEKWVPNYCTKELGSLSSTTLDEISSKGALEAATRKRYQKEERHGSIGADTAPKRLNVGQGKKKGNQASRHIKDASEPLRRSFWQQDRIQDNGYGQPRRTTRLSEKNLPKRRIRKPKWLLEDSGTVEDNNVATRIRKHRLKHQKDCQSPIEKRSESGQIKNNTKQKPSVNSNLKQRENSTKHPKGFSLDCLKPAFTPQVILELSLPDNELMGTFTEDTCNRHRGYPQMLLYKPTVKLSASSQTEKAVHGKEVILRARDEIMFIQQLHCYARLQKGKGNGYTNTHGSVSTITRSSVQGSPPKDPPKELSEMAGSQMNNGLTSQTLAAGPTESTVLMVSQAQNTEIVLQNISVCELPDCSFDDKVEVPRRVLDTPNVMEHQISDGLQHQTTEKLSPPKASALGLCEESAVEMKVIIASPTPSLVITTHTQTVDNINKTQTTDLVSKTLVSTECFTAHKSQVTIYDELSPVAKKKIFSDKETPCITQCDSKDGKASGSIDKDQQFGLVISQPEDNKICSEVKPKQGAKVLDTNRRTSFEMSETEDTCHLSKSNSVADMSTLTLVTEMVTEFAPVENPPELDNQKQRVAMDSPSKQSMPVLDSNTNVAHELRTLTSNSVPEYGPSAIPDFEDDCYLPEEPNDSEPMEPTAESEESKLEFCCTFCNKVFKGSRVVGHAMFHFRKDECMFCRSIFKDDLLAMMHLSDHIEKLKRNKESSCNKAQQSWLSESKDFSSPNTSAKAKSTNMSTRHRSSSRTRKTSVCPKSSSETDSDLSQSRKLRSYDKSIDGKFLQKEKLNMCHNRKASSKKVNGHIGKKKPHHVEQVSLTSEAKLPLSHQGIAKEGAIDTAVSHTVQETCNKNESSATSIQGDDFDCSKEEHSKEPESLQTSMTPTNPSKAEEVKKLEPIDKVSCPADGCTWLTDLSKNRVALLYHALECHYGDSKPLQLSFQIGNNRCSICMRVLWSFEHFQHHVERHRHTPRHPCLHLGCSARFKTGMEMRRHARKHSPLQAVCCQPGCSKRFICLWALNLHEKDHYASKGTKPVKNTNIQIDHKHNTQVAKKQQSHKPKGATSAISVKKKTHIKISHKLRRQSHPALAPEKTASVPGLATVKASALKQQRLRNACKDSNVLKNLSNKETADSIGPNLRQTLRKGHVKKTDMKSSSVFSLQLLKRNNKLRHNLKKLQMQGHTKDHHRRGRPSKAKKTVHDENTTAGQNNKTLEHHTILIHAAPLQTSGTQTLSSLEGDEKNQHNQDVKMTGAATSESNQSSHNDMSRNSTTPTVEAGAENQTFATILTVKSHKMTAENKMKPHVMKKRCALRENGQNSFSGSSNAKKLKIQKNKVNTKTVKKKCRRKEAGLSAASIKPAKSKSVDPQMKTKAAVNVVESTADMQGKRMVEITDSTQNSPGESMPTGSVKSLNVPTTSGEKVQVIATQERSMKSHIMKKSKSLKERTTKTLSHREKKHKVNNKKCEIQKTKISRPCKDQGNTPASQRTKSLLVIQQFESKEIAAIDLSPDVEVKADEEPLDAKLDSSGSTLPATIADSIHEKTPPVTAGAKHTKKESRKKNNESHIRKKSGNTRKVLNPEGEMKNVKKKCPSNKNKDIGSKKASRSKPKPLEITEITAGGVASSGSEDGIVLQTTSDSKPRWPGRSVQNGKPANQEARSTVCKDALAEYGKKPYMRPPPTAYLDERFITMPKRRKKMPSLQSSETSCPPVQSDVTTLQRQRCANCFASFNSPEELQSHRQQQRCSNIFGFDSDEEGNG